MVTKLIRDQEEAELHRAAGLLERLEKERSEMKERVAEISKLDGHIDDHIYFIQVPRSASHYHQQNISPCLTSHGLLLK